MLMPLRRWIATLALGLPTMALAQESAPPQFSWTPHTSILFPADWGDTGSRIRTGRVGLDVGGMWGLGDRLRLGLESGMEYSHYRFKDFDSVIPGMAPPVRDLFSVRLAPSLVYGLNSKWSLVGGSSLGLNGDAEANAQDAFTIGGYAGARRQFSERFALTFGILGTTRLEEDIRVLPLVGIDWQIARRWHLGVQGPGGQLSYAIKETSTNAFRLFMRMAFDSRDFRLDPHSTIPEGVLRDQSFPVSVGFEWQPSPAATFTLQAGSAFARSLEFTDRDGRTLVDEDTTGSTFISMALKVGFQSAPRKPGAGAQPDSKSGEDSSCEGCNGGHVLQFWEENDSLTGTDHAYTQGIRITWLGAEHGADAAPAWLNWFANGLPSIGYDVDTARGGITLGQNIYTPEEIHVTALQPSDRPYAAWIYGAPTLQRRGRTGGGAPVLEQLRMDLGLIGPGALGGEAQNFIHRNFKIALAKGWENQLHNEPTAAFTYARAWRLHIGGDRDAGAVEWIPHMALTGGTPRTQAAIGGTLRMGFRLPDDFGQPTIRSSLPSSGSGRPEGFGIHMFAGLEGRAVARDSTIDGNLWTDSHHQESEPLGLEGRLGVVATWRRVDLGFTYAYESRDYKGQEDNHDYGSVWLNWRL